MFRINNGKLIIKKKRNIEFIDLSKVLFIERFNNKTYIQVADKNEIVTNVPLKDLEVVLPPNFKRSHRSFIINKEYLEGLKLLNEKTYEANFPNDKQALVLKEHVEYFLRS
ncbi:LytTR family transcriptional regulator DNA-binding domain-containing protein [Paenibacillus apiarius]|uniref:LytTR family transcriptional regulator DNA-binding domain-containing protein n=1 Tax=Paenibacillus apiarius TaxID=46240 RepID=UPI003B3A89EB